MISGKLVRIIAIVFILSKGNMYSQTTSTTTSLTEPSHIREFLDATQRLRCICLPSLPIQGCSYNMCVVSSYLKTFIENRIRDGMTADEIVEKFEKGFGDSIFNEPLDSVVLHFQLEDNQRMLQSLKDGFGKNIQAKPDSTWINLSLGLIGILALIGISLYLVKRKNTNIPSTNEENNLSQEKLNNLENKYLKEL